MTDDVAIEHEPVLVRDLECLVIFVDNQEISIALSKSESESIADYLNDVYDDVSRKVAHACPRELHFVYGSD